MTQEREHGTIVGLGQIVTLMPNTFPAELYLFKGYFEIMKDLNI